MTASEQLVYSIALNTLAPNGNAWRACLDTNVKALAWGLQGMKDDLNLKKGEFETAVTYDARQEKLSSILNGIGQVLVCQSLDDNEDVAFAYDADRQVFSASLSSHLRADLDFKKTGSYVSKTRMGVRATVEQYLDVEYMVSMSAGLKGAFSDCMKTASGRITFDVPVPIDRAPYVKSNGYLALLGRLTPPFIEEQDTQGEPTIDHPKDVYEKELSIHFEPEVALIVTQDGQEAFRCAINSSAVPDSECRGT